jgi:hypothetical protein
MDNEWRVRERASVTKLGGVSMSVALLVSSASQRRSRAQQCNHVVVRKYSPQFVSLVGLLRQN